MRLPDISVRAYQRLTLLALFLLGAIIVTGAAVRLSGSGLGCRDWPNCEPGELIGVANPSQRIEQLNRLFTGLVCIVVIAAVLGAKRRVPRRDDLVTLSWALVVGVLFQAVLGGISVKMKLAPVSVMGHFLASIVLVGIALVLHHRAAVPEKPARMVPVVSESTRWLARAVFALTVWVLIAGTLVTAAGPHGGDAAAKRLSWPIPDAARLHGESVDLLLICIVVLAWRLHHDRAPRRVLNVVSFYLVIACAQAALGYIQYANAIPVVLVGFHIAGAVLVFSAAMQLQLELTVPAGAEAVSRARGFRSVVAPFRYDRTFGFDVSRAVLWDALNDTAHYPNWWPWLRSFDAADLSVGTVAHCAVRAPLPYTLEFQVLVAAVEPGISIDEVVSGDLTGPARLEVSGEGEISEARLTWTVELRVPMLSAASLVARPVLVWAHDRVVETGLAEFREHTLTPRGRG